MFSGGIDRQHRAVMGQVNLIELIELIYSLLTESIVRCKNF